MLRPPSPAPRHARFVPYARLHSPRDITRAARLRAPPLGSSSRPATMHAAAHALRTSEPEPHWQVSLATKAIRQSPSLTTAGGSFERNWPGRPTPPSSRRGPRPWDVRPGPHRRHARPRSAPPRAPLRGRVRAARHGRHASRSSLQPRLRLSRRLARRREVSIERAAQLSVIVLGEPQITIARDPAFLGHDVLASKDGLIRLKIALRCP